MTPLLAQLVYQRVRSDSITQRRYAQWLPAVRQTAGSLLLGRQHVLLFRSRLALQPRATSANGTLGPNPPPSELTGVPDMAVTLINADGDLSFELRRSGAFVLLIGRLQTRIFAKW